MPVELFEDFFTPDDTVAEASSRTTRFKKFIDGFNDYGSEHFDISPKSHPSFFYQMFLASIFYLHENELSQNLLTNEMHYKNDAENRVLKLAYRRDESSNSRLVLRLIDFSNYESLDHDFTDDEINELMLNLEVHQGKNTIDYKKVVMDHTGVSFIRDGTTDARLRGYDANVVVKAFYERTFLITTGRTDTAGIQYPIMFSFLGSSDPDEVLNAADDIFIEMKNAYSSAPNSFKIQEPSIQRQAAFLAGILVSNLKSRYVFQVHVANKKDSIQLHMMSDISLSQSSPRIPVIFDITSIDDPSEFLRTKNMINLLGVQMHPALVTNSKTSIHVLSESLDNPNSERHASIIKDHNKYVGVLRKIIDHFDGCNEDQCVNKEYLQDMAQEVTQELEYSMNILNSRSKNFVDRFIMGQIMSSDTSEMYRYKYEYTGDSMEDTSTYVLYVDSAQKQIVINVMQESDLKYEELSQFKGRIVPHHHDKVTYESLIVNLIVDQNKLKTKATAKYHVVNLKQWHDAYNSAPDRGVSLKKFLAERGVIFSGIAKTLVSYNFNEVLYNTVSVLQENPGYMNDLMAYLHSQYKTYFRNEAEFVAFCKGAAVEKFDLLMSYKTNPDILALRREKRRWYSYAKEQYLSDRFQTTILMKVARVDHNNEEMTNELFSRVTQFYAVVHDEMRKTGQKPMAYAVSFSETKSFVKLLEYEVTRAEPTPSNVAESLSSMCLSSKSHRTKRENVRKECLYDWEDVDQFKKNENSNNQGISLDEEKFLNYLAGVGSKEKRLQLLDLAEEQDNIQNSKLKHLISQSKLIKRLSGISKMSHMVMRSFMLKNIVTDLLSGDFKGLAMNLGFIGGSYLTMKVSDTIKARAMKLTLANKAAFRNAVKIAAPFVSRLTLAYNIYHLYKSIQAYKNGSSEALLNIVNDGTFVLVDTVEIGAELLEAFGVIEGLTSIVFPVGTALAAITMLGTEIYTVHQSFKALEQINQEIHLTKSEWLVESCRSLVGMRIHGYLPKLAHVKELNQHLVNENSMLLGQPGIDHVIFSTEQVCRSMNARCDNTLIVLEPTFRTQWNRARPNTVDNVSLSCYSENYVNPYIHQQQLKKILGNDSHLAAHFRSGVPGDGIFTIQESYFCQNAIGLSRKNAKSGAAYIETGNGVDYVIGLKNHSNIVMMGNGMKHVVAGANTDTFVANGETRGTLNGSGGQNMLDLQKFSTSLEKILIVVREQATHMILLEKSEILLTAFSVYDIIMRNEKADLLICQTCNTKYIESGHVTEDHFSKIWISSSGNCSHNMQVVLNGNVKLKNRASKGIFYYRVQNLKAHIKLKYNKKKKVQHVIILNFELSRVESIQKVEDSVILKTFEGLNLTFKLFNRRVSLVFVDRIEVKAEKSKMLATCAINSVSDAFKYIDIAERLKIIFAIRVITNNETILIGHSTQHSSVNNTKPIHHTANIIRNNPTSNSHLIGGNGEYMYVISFPLDKTVELANYQFYNTTIYFYKDKDNWNLTDTIDINEFTQSIENLFDIRTELSVESENNDIILNLYGINRNITYNLFSVILKSAFDLEWYKKVTIIHHRPLNISYLHGNHSGSHSPYHQYGKDIPNVDVQIFHEPQNDLKLLPLELIFNSNVSMIIIQEKDIEPNTTIRIERPISKINFIHHETNLLIFVDTDAAHADSGLLIILTNFFTRRLSNLHTMNLEFDNFNFNLLQELTLKGFVTLDQLISDEDKFLQKLIHNS